MISIRAWLNDQGRSVNVGVMAGSAAVILALPVVARLYGVDAVGVAGAMSAIGMVLTPVIAQGLPESVQSADRKVAVQAARAWVTTVVIVTALVVLGLAGGAMVGLLDLERAVLLGLGFLVGLSYAVTFMVYAARTRRAELHLIGTYRAAQGFMVAGLQIGLGLLWPSAETLLMAQIMGVGGSALLLAIAKRPVFAGGFSTTPPTQQASSAERITGAYRLRSATGGAMIGLFLQSPVLLTTAFFGPGAAGQTVMAVRVLSVPFTYFGVGPNYFLQQEVGRVLREKSGHITPHLQRVVSKLAKTSTVVFAAIAVGSFFAPVILGPGFGDVGWYILCLIPGYYLQMVSEPALRLLLVIRDDAAYLLVTTLRVVLVALGAAVVLLAGGGPLVLLVSFSVAALLSQAWIIVVAKRKSRRLDSGTPLAN